jgi:hypothetical protein
VAQLRVARLTQDGAPLGGLLDLAGASTAQTDDAAVRSALAQVVPEYQSAERRAER